MIMIMNIEAERLFGLVQSNFMGSQRVGHDWATELNWTELNLTFKHVENFLRFDKEKSWSISPHKAKEENSFIKRKKEVGRTVENNEPKAFLWLSPCQERREEANKKLHRRWGGWLRNVECDENSGKCLLHQVQKWLMGTWSFSQWL